MTTKQSTLGALSDHLHHAMTVHAPFSSDEEILNRLTDRLTKLHAAIGSLADTDHEKEVGRRLMQVAAIAIRGFEDLALTAAPPKPTSRPSNPPDHCFTEACECKYCVHVRANRTEPPPVGPLPICPVCNSGLTKPRVVTAPNPELN